MLAVLCCAGPVLVANVGFAGVLTLLRTPPSLIVAAILALIVATAIVKRSPRTVYNGQQRSNLSSRKWSMLLKKPRSAL